MVGAGISGYLITLYWNNFICNLPFLIGALGVALFLKKKIEILWVRILGGILLIFSVSPILGILDNFANIKLPLETGRYYWYDCGLQVDRNILAFLAPVYCWLWGFLYP